MPVDPVVEGAVIEADWGNQVAAAVAALEAATPAAIITTRGDLVRGNPAGDAERVALGAANSILASDGTDAIWRTLAAELAILLTTRGDLVTRDAGGVARLPVGAAGRLLRSDGTDPAWTALATVLADILTTRGDLLTRQAGGVARLAVGTANQYFASDGTDAGWRSRKGCEVSRASQSIATGTAPVLVSFTDADTTDTDAFHDPASNAGRLIVPTGLGGWYLVHGSVDHAGDVSTAGMRKIYLGKNAAGGLTDAAAHLSHNSSSAVTGLGQGFLDCAWVGKLAAGDYVELYYAQNSGAARTCSGQAQMILLGA